MFIQQSTQPTKAILKTAITFSGEQPSPEQLYTEWFDTEVATLSAAQEQVLKELEAKKTDFVERFKAESDTAHAKFENYTAAVDTEPAKKPLTWQEYQSARYSEAQKERGKYSKIDSFKSSHYSEWTGTRSRLYSQWNEFDKKIKIKKLELIKQNGLSREALEKEEEKFLLASSKKQDHYYSLTDKMSDKIYSELDNFSNTYYSFWDKYADGIHSHFNKNEKALELLDPFRTTVSEDMRPIFKSILQANEKGFKNFSKGQTAQILSYVKSIFFNPNGNNKFFRELYQNSSYSNFLKKYPLEAELLLLLTPLYSKTMREKYQQKLNSREIASFRDSAVMAISNTYRFLSNGISELENNVTQIWSQIGFSTHNFSRFKYDTRPFQTEGMQLSLFERFGLKKLAREESQKHPFGESYLLDNSHRTFPFLDPKTKMEFRHGYILITNPEQGTLVIRNSSTVFGRDLLDHTAYYSNQGTAINELPSFTPAQNRFKHILTPELYKEPTNAANMDFLLQEYFKFQDNYNFWKCDLEKTTDGSFTGFLNAAQTDFTNGFSSLLNAAHQAALHSPEHHIDLALVSKDVPLWLQEPYAHYRITADKLPAFQKMIETKGIEMPKDFAQFLSQCYEYGKLSDLVIRDVPMTDAEKIEHQFKLKALKPDNTLERMLEDVHFIDEQPFAAMATNVGDLHYSLN